jgi:hypothetical protein
VLVLSLLAAGACSAEGDSAPASSPSARSDASRGGGTAAGSARDTTSAVHRRFRAVLGIVAGLREEALLRGTDVKVSGSGTTIVLAGEVPSAAARERAVEIARGHAGAFTLVDSLRVGGAGASASGPAGAEPANAGGPPSGGAP